MNGQKNKTINYRSKTIRREPQRKKPTTLNSGMLEDQLAVPAVSKAPELSSTIQLMVMMILYDCLKTLKTLGLL